MSGVIEIDTLKLEDMTEEEGRRTARAFEDTLTELLSREGLPGGRTREDIARVDLGQLPVVSQTPEGIGRDLARALFAELWR
ncbi:MAG: hypothetical protein V2I24_07265 [Halieaceae bacterium]|jgi:hypothetical protein|nr:hypothetical protein [Halieaceae bacterium]